MDLLFGFFASFSFLLGGLLYSWAKEEIELVSRTSFPASCLFPALSILSGIAYAFLLKKELLFYILILFAADIAASSFLLAGKNNKAVLKYSLIGFSLCFVSFLLAYFLLYMLD